MVQSTLVDSHCHLDFDEFAEDREAVLARARAAGVADLLIAAVAPRHWARVRGLAAEQPGIWAAAGVHPNEDPGCTPDLDRLLEALGAPKVIATGETGLDYFRSEGDLSWQRQRFALHIAAARQSRKPLIVHTRAAAGDTLELLRSEQARDVGGVIHCFTEDWDFARRAMDLGFYISLSGIVTFKKSTELQEVARKIPADRLLIETDAPFLAPVPQRGRRNEPAYVAHVADFVARLRAEDPQDLAAQTRANFFRCFPAAGVAA